ncbi:hypothetical protein CDD80_4878 [Ophiocordyceps camponoti-rufipedis]|uniref:Uncharacterized protein n=1 Tax=Ophiocordyceps camponoti-rufipedis TaxID=2004952 RepID=A0A2C5YX91_9HYPO|nr:hypothetical protein CDD80_4878 [Ophiocordyceps camponoti-rufipedis]
MALASATRHENDGYGDGSRQAQLRIAQAMNLNLLLEQAIPRLPHSRPSTSSRKAAVVSPIHATGDATRPEPPSRFPSQQYHSGASPLGFIQPRDEIGPASRRWLQAAASTSFHTERVLVHPSRLLRSYPAATKTPRPRNEKGAQRGVDRRTRASSYPSPSNRLPPNPVGTPVCWFGLQPRRPKPPGISEAALSHTPPEDFTPLSKMPLGSLIGNNVMEHRRLALLVPRLPRRFAQCNSLDERLKPQPGSSSRPLTTSGQLGTSRSLSPSPLLSTFLVKTVVTVYSYRAVRPRLRSQPKYDVCRLGDWAMHPRLGRNRN